MVAENSSVWRVSGSSFKSLRMSAAWPVHHAVRLVQHQDLDVVEHERLARVQLNKRSTVATSVDAGSRSRRSCTAIGAAVCTSATRSSVKREKSRACASTCVACSRVGVSTMARNFCGPSSRRANMGSRNAPVLPEPLGAFPIRSLPWRITGMALPWIGVGSFRPAARVA